MSIASTYAKVSSGSARLSYVHARMQTTADLCSTARSISPIENVMRTSPSRLRRTASPPMASRPVTAGCARPFVTGGSALDRATRPYTAVPPSPSQGERPPISASSVRPLGRPNTAYAPRRAAQLAALNQADNTATPPSADYATPPRRPVNPCGWMSSAEATPIVHSECPPMTSNTAADHHPAANSGKVRFPEVVTVSEGELADALLGMKLLPETEEEMADDSLLAELEEAYVRLRDHATMAYNNHEESPMEKVQQLRSAVQSARDFKERQHSDRHVVGNEERNVQLEQPTFATVTDPDVLLLWTWSYVEDNVKTFLQEVKRGCCVGGPMAEGIYAQCEAIVGGVTSGALPWDVPSVYSPNLDGVASSSNNPSQNATRVDNFMEKYTAEHRDCVLGAVRSCAALEGMPWCDAADSLWLCVLQHMRVGMDVPL